jgi:hypothetical protein
MATLYHGTGGHLEAKIRREGLRQCYPGRGVSMVSGVVFRLAGVDPLDIEHADNPCMTGAMCSALRHREATGGSYTTATGLLICIDRDLVPDTIVSSKRTHDGRVQVKGSYVLAPHVPPQAIIRMEHVALRLPAPGSVSAWYATRLGGYGRRETRRTMSVRPRLDIARAEAEAALNTSPTQRLGRS